MQMICLDIECIPVGIEVTATRKGMWDYWIRKKRTEMCTSMEYRYFRNTLLFNNGVWHWRSFIAGVCIYEANL